MARPPAPRRDRRVGAALRQRHVVRPSALAKSADGTLVVSGETARTVRDWDIALLGVAPNGTLAWNRLVGGVDADRSLAFVSVPDGFLLWGSSESFGAAGTSRAFLLVTDASGIPPAACALEDTDALAQVDAPPIVDSYELFDLPRTTSDPGVRITVVPATCR